MLTPVLALVVMFCAQSALSMRLTPPGSEARQVKPSTRGSRRSAHSHARMALLLEDPTDQGILRLFASESAPHWMAELKQVLESAPDQCQFVPGLKRALTLRGGSLAGTLSGVSKDVVVRRMMLSAIGLATLGGGGLAFANVMEALSIIADEQAGPGARMELWNALKQMLESAPPVTVAKGAAKEHAHAVRREAARKLITNRAAVLQDITRPDGTPASQRQLQRLPGQERDVDAALYETARRLAGWPDSTSGAAPRRMRPTTAQQAATWSATAAYLCNRVQSTPVEVANVPGHEARGPDMSSGAAAAFRAVLREVGSETPIFPAPTLLKMLRREPALAWGTAEPALA